MSVEVVVRVQAAGEVLVVYLAPLYNHNHNHHRHDHHHHNHNHHHHHCHNDTNTNRLAVKALGADDAELIEPEEQEDMEYTFAYTVRLLQHLMLTAPPHDARALPPTAAALRRRRLMQAGVPWPGAAQSGLEEEDGGENCSTSTARGRAVVHQQQQAGEQQQRSHRNHRRLIYPPWWTLELHMGALPRSPAAWGDLATLPQLATLLLPAQRPRLPAAALPHIALLTGLRALQMSVAGAAHSGGVGLLAGPGMAVAGGPEEELWARIDALSALTALTHLGMHCNALPTRPLSRALAALTNLRDLFIAGECSELGEEGDSAGKSGLCMF